MIGQNIPNKLCPSLKLLLVHGHALQQNGELGHIRACALTHKSVLQFR
jgi:hypothetical protein